LHVFIGKVHSIFKVKTLHHFRPFHLHIDDSN
jgi:hypothetical protein